jgi:capsular polysaccharide biosynthesis protein
MEMKQHLDYLRRSLIFIVVFGLVVAVVTGMVAQQRPASYNAVLTYELALVNRSVTPDYQYGSYYDLKGAELMTQHAMSLLRSPAVIEEIYQAAGLGYTIDNLDWFTSQFRTDQDSSQHFTVKYGRYTAAEAEALAEGMTTVLTTAISQAQTDTAGHGQFALTAHDPVIVYTEVNVWLLAGLGALAGWLAAIVLVYLKRYLQN